MIFGFVWWVLALAVILVAAVTGALAARNTILAFGLLVVGSVGLSLLNGINPASWAWENPDLFFMGVGGYLVAGLVTAFIRFIIYTNSDDTQEMIRLAHRQWQTSGDSTPFKQSRYNPMGFSKDFPRIVYWTFFWPFVLVLNLCGELLVKLITWAGRKFSGIFGMVADSAIDKALKSK